MNFNSVSPIINPKSYVELLFLSYNQNKSRKILLYEILYTNGTSKDKEISEIREENE